MEELRLIAQPSNREGYETFTDLYLTWRYNDKVYCVRVRPQFYKDFKMLFGIATHIERGEPVEKYL